MTTTTTLPVTTEVAWQRTVIEAAAMLGWHHFHVQYSIGSQRGFPDLVLVHPDHGVVYAELKSERGKVRPEQVTWINLLRDAGQQAFVWRPSDWPFVERVLKGEA